MAGTHFKGGVYGDYRSLGGLLEDAPIDLVSRVGAGAGRVNFIDFDNATVDILNFTANDIGSPNSDTGAVAAGSVYLLNAGDANDTGLQAEMTTGHITPTDLQDFAFVARFKTSDADNGAAFVGLAVALTTTDAIHATTGALSYVNCIGFFTPEATADLTLECRRSSGSGTGSVAVTTLANDTFVEVGFRAVVNDISSDTLNGYVEAYYKSGGRWVKVGRVDAAIPNASLGFVMVCKNLTEDTDLTVDYLGSWWARG